MSVLFLLLTSPRKKLDIYFFVLFCFVLFFFCFFFFCFVFVHTFANCNIHNGEKARTTVTTVVMLHVWSAYSTVMSSEYSLKQTPLYF